MDELLTVKEVAEKMKITEKSVRRYVAEGMLKAIKLERVLRFREDDIEEFLTERTINAKGG